MTTQDTKEPALSAKGDYRIVSRRQYGMIVSFIFVAVALRVLALGDAAVWWDEAWSVWVAQQNIAETTRLTASDVHPPLYQWALHLWVRLAGISEFAVRYLSVAWSTLTVAMIYAIARRVGTSRMAWIALVFAATSAFAIHWAQETRMYAQTAFFTAWLSYIYLRLRAVSAHHQGVRGWWVALVIAGAGVALSHYLGAFVLVIINLHWLLTLPRPTRAFHGRWVAAMTITAGILLLWVAYAIGLTRSGNIDNDFSALLAFQLFATLMVAGTSINIHEYALITGGLTLIYALGLARYASADDRQESALLIALMALLPPLAIYLLSLIESSFYSPKPEERYMIIFTPVLFVGIGAVIDQLARVRRIGSALAILVMGIWLTVYALAYARDWDARYMQDDYATMISTVATLAQPNEPILFVSDDRYPLVYYHFNRVADDHYSDFRIEGITSPLGQVQSTNMQRHISGADRFWVIQIERHFRDPDGLTIAWFDERFTRVYHEAVAHNSITLYARDDQTPPQSERILAPTVDQARPFDTVRVGATADVTWWYGDQRIRRDRAQGWQLSQWTVYPAYPNGQYTVQIGDQRHPFRVTHSQPAPDAPQTTLNADFGDLTLVGYDLPRRQLAPGMTFDVHLYWHVDAVPAVNDTVFAQLLGPFRADGIVWASDDGYPADTPTTALWAGLTFIDTHTFTVPPDMPAGTHRLAFGLYPLETGDRHTTQNGQDAIIIEGIDIGVE